MNNPFDGQKTANQSVGELMGGLLIAIGVGIGLSYVVAEIINMIRPPKSQRLRLSAHRRDDYPDAPDYFDEEDNPYDDWDEDEPEEEDEDPPTSRRTTGQWKAHYRKHPGIQRVHFGETRGSPQSYALPSPASSVDSWRSYSDTEPPSSSPDVSSWGWTHEQLYGAKQAAVQSSRRARISATRAAKKIHTLGSSAYDKALKADWEGYEKRARAKAHRVYEGARRAPWGGPVNYPGLKAGALLGPRP